MIIIRSRTKMTRSRWRRGIEEGGHMQDQSRDLIVASRKSL